MPSGILINFLLDDAAEFAPIERFWNKCGMTKVVEVFALDFFHIATAQDGRQPGLQTQALFNQFEAIHFRHTVV